VTSINVCSLFLGNLLQYARRNIRAAEYEVASLPLVSMRAVATAVGLAERTRRIYEQKYEQKGDLTRLWR